MVAPRCRDLFALGSMPVEHMPAEREEWIRSDWK